MLSSNLRFAVIYIYVYMHICIHVYIYIYAYVYSVFLFFLHNCPLLIPLHNTAVLIKICRFLINVAKFMQTLTKLDLPMLRKGST